METVGQVPVQCVRTWPWVLRHRGIPLPPRRLAADRMLPSTAEMVSASRTSTLSVLNSPARPRTRLSTALTSILDGWPAHDVGQWKSTPTS